MITFRPYQRDCIDAFYRYYSSGKTGNGLIVVPTAGGKSLIIGGLATEICRKWPGQRILILAHVRELIQQNHGKVMACWNEASAGVYCAALGLRQADCDIVVGSIQSVHRRVEDIGRFDLCFIDEVHLVQFGNMGMYGALIKALHALNPEMKICGFTATDYRTDGGLLIEGEKSLFQDVIIEIPIQHLLDEGYLTPPISKSSLVQADMSGVKITAGDFNAKQMGEIFDQQQFVNAALDSDMQYLVDRKSIALFCATLENAAHVAAGMRERGFDCDVIDGSMSAEDREDILERFRSGELRALASVGVITTGTDIPNMDAVVMFRATKSAGLYQQIVGRGFRVMYADGYDISTREGRLDAIKYGSKPNFLMLDHGENIERHGPITHVRKPQKKAKGERGIVARMLARVCDICRSGWPLDITICGTCGNQLKVERDPTTSLSVEASNADIMGDEFMRGEKAKWFDVDDVRYARHRKQGAPDSLKVTYFCGIMEFSEWQHFERIGMRKAAFQWWGTRTIKPPPDTVGDALKWSATLKRPMRIQVAKRENIFEVLRYEFQPARQEQFDRHAAGGA